jgi:hypothetical protein
MSKARPPIPENTKVALLRETNYRCGYCIMNITPAAYFTENRCSTEAKEVVPMYYQPYDCAHIEPYNEEDPATNSFYNLIALCKNCHWKTEPKHSNAIITKEQLKALKLHWMIASGRFTRLEIDVLMELYKVHVNALDIMKNFTTVGTPDIYIRYRELHKQEMWIHLVLKPINNQTETYIDPNFNCNEEMSLKPSIYVITYMYFLFFKVIDKKFLHDDGNQLQVNGAIPFTHLSLTELGIEFCKKFHEAYKELDKIEI